VFFFLKLRDLSPSIVAGDEREKGSIMSINRLPELGS